MIETKPMELRQACLDDLDKLCKVGNVKNKNAVMLSKSALKVLENANKYRISGDEENAYIYYMKFVQIVIQTKETLDYEISKSKVLSILNNNHITEALNWIEKLKESLISRYNEKKKKNESEHHNIIRQKIDTDRQKAKEILENPITFLRKFPDESELSIKARHLFTLLEDLNNKILIMDARSKLKYSESHMTFSQCINIPEEIIKPGHSTNIMEKHIPPESMRLWSKRKDMDLIVLLDHSSTTFVSGTTLHILQTTLLKWDVKVTYKRKPILLEGGYESWLLCYPSYTTNPHIDVSNHNMALDDLLNDIDYPMLIDSISPHDNRNIFNSNNIKQSTDNIIKEVGSRPNSNFNPMVDRSSKAAALETYEKTLQAKKRLLEEQENLANTLLDIEKERIIAEKSWEKVHQTREKEDEEGKKEHLQLQEDELVSRLLQLESQHNDTSTEIEQVKGKLNIIKKEKQAKNSMMVSSDSSISSTSGVGVISPNANTQPFIESIGDIGDSQEEEEALGKEAHAKEIRIKEKEYERELLERQREMMQIEREKKLAEARALKSLLYKKQLEESDREMVPLKHEEAPSGFNRSHSSPNITQMLDEEMVMQSKTPQFDRTMKPIHKVTNPSDIYQARQRDFQGVWGCMGRGLTGLKNLGNTCYMNSIMQCLSNTADLAVYFCGDTYRDDVREAQICNKGKNGTGGAVAEEVAAVVKALWSGQYRFISAKDLRNVIGKHQIMFRGIEQQDSHEFLTILMDWLHNDLQTPSRLQIRMDIPSEKAWHEYTKSKESPILRLFYGQIKSTLTCIECRKESITHDSFSNLSLELPVHANKCTLADCLELYLQDERIYDWNCPSCKQKREAVKKLDISRLPPILVIHFKRFYVDPKDYISNTYRKKLTNIDFPLKNLDMGEFSLHSYKDSKNVHYNLYGVSNHYGSMEGGHYTAYCKSSIYSKWYKFDDHVVSEISSSEVKSSAAYILFYTSLMDNH